MAKEEWHANMKKEEGLYIGKGKATLICENGKKNHTSLRSSEEGDPVKGPKPASL